MCDELWASRARRDRTRTAKRARGGREPAAAMAPPGLKTLLGSNTFPLVRDYVDEAGCETLLRRGGARRRHARRTLRSATNCEFPG